MIDINDLDRHVGQYVDLQNADEGAAGYLVDIQDEVHYEPGPTRWVVFDWGQSFPVSAETVITFPEPPEGETPPDFINPVRAVHLAMHDEASCADAANCAYEEQAVRALKALRIWRMKQTDALWENRYVRRVRSYAETGDGHDVGEIIRDAVHEGAPPHMIDRMKTVASRILEKTQPGQPEDTEVEPDFDPFASKWKG